MGKREMEFIRIHSQMEERDSEKEEEGKMRKEN
jgi:hypothetical protein